MPTASLASAPATLGWSDERTDLLRKLWDDGLSCGAIATRLAGGLTRNAVIGKLHRLGLNVSTRSARLAHAPRSTPPGGRKPVVMKKPVACAAITRDATRAEAVAKLPPPVTESRARDNAAPAAAEPANDGAGVAFVDTITGQCRWPIAGDGADMRCCGADVGVDFLKPYCSAHSRLAYAPRPKTPAVSTAVLRRAS